MSDIHTPGTLAHNILSDNYAAHKGETWEQVADRVVSGVIDTTGGSTAAYARAYGVVSRRQFMPGGRYLYSMGVPDRPPQNSNCFLFRAGDSLRAWAQLFHDVSLVSGHGGGCGIEYSSIRPEGAPIKRGGVASGPVSLMHGVNDQCRLIKQAGQRRSALWAGLNWTHPDIFTFIESKDWSKETRALKAANFDHPAPLDQTNISTGLDEKFFAALARGNGHAQAVWDLTMHRALLHGEPGFSVNINRSDDLRNPCCEVTSDVTGDTCNLGSPNFARIRNLDHLEEVVRIATQFLYRGNLAGWLPDGSFAGFEKVRAERMRVGVGIMGLGEWCLIQGQPYGPSEKLEEWLKLWQEVSDDESVRIAKTLGHPKPIAVRAVAPTGSLALLAETTSGIEPVVSKAYLRTVRKKDGYKQQYVVDPAAKRAVDRGWKPEDIDDAYSVPLERRLAMQALVQKYTDMAISSTVNLPPHGEPGNDDDEKTKATVLKYLPQLRGITFYPDGARGGQPIQRVSLEDALSQDGAMFEFDPEASCKDGVCGI